MRVFAMNRPLLFVRECGSNYETLLTHNNNMEYYIKLQQESKVHISGLSRCDFVILAYLLHFIYKDFQAVISVSHDRP